MSKTLGRFVVGVIKEQAKKEYFLTWLEPTELGELEIELLVAHERADFMANQYVLTDPKAWAKAKAEVSRIEGEILKLKEQDND